MTNIAIFGDSFAASPHLENSKLVEGFLKEIYNICNREYDAQEVSLLRKKWGEKYKGWPRYLDADIYSYSGSDIYYSYNQFLNNHSKYEKCIFVITGTLRYSSNINGWMHSASIEDAVEGAKFATNKVVRNYYTTLSEFFQNIYYKDINRIESINTAMIDSIKLRRPDTLFINAFPDLKNVYDLELNSWNMTHEESQDYTKYFDLRHCHMTNENNKILAEYIKENLNQSSYLDLSNIKWKVPTVADKDFHIIKTKDLFSHLL